MKSKRLKHWISLILEFFFKKFKRGFVFLREKDFLIFRFKKKRLFFFLFIGLSFFSFFFLKNDFFSLSFLNSFKEPLKEPLIDETRGSFIQGKEKPLRDKDQKIFDLPLRCQRIVSLSPNITEILFLLGLGDQVKAVTRFCNYPKATKTKKKIGGFLDLNFEAILKEKPSVLFALESHRNYKKKLKSLNFNWFFLKIQSVEEILRAIESIGRYCGVEKKLF